MGSHFPPDRQNQLTRKRAALRGMYLLLLAGIMLAACAGLEPLPTPTLPADTATASATPSTTASFTPSPTTEPTFPLPIYTPITPIPPPFALELPPEVHVGVFLGLDAVTPYAGQSDAVAIVLINQNTARASVISLAPDMFVYIPGLTMQRLNIAFPSAGFQGISDTLRYNFGVRPDFYAAVHLDDFVNLVDDLGGITIQAAQGVHEYCGDNPPGRVDMDGQQAFCHLRLRFDTDEADRSRRQDEVFRGVLARFVRGGTLARLPALYERYKDSIESNLDLRDLTGLVPLALRLGDPRRVEFYYLANDDLEIWTLPDMPLRADVLLPDQGEVQSTMRQALAFVLAPEPESDLAATLAYQLTISPTPTNTATATNTPTRTNTPYRSPIPSRTPTGTATRTPGPSRTPTEPNYYPVTDTLTPTPSETPSPTP